MRRAITGISSMATRAILRDLACQYQEMTGTQVAITPMGGVDAARLVRAGEATDIVVLASNVVIELEAEGHIISGSAVEFARSGMGIAVRVGAKWPDINDGEAVRRAISTAGKVCYSTGPSGNRLLRLCEHWELTAGHPSRDSVFSRCWQEVLTPPGGHRPARLSELI